MFNALTLLSAALLAATSVIAKPCVVFDASWNLYAFGAQGANDWNLGLQDSWTAGKYAGRGSERRSFFRLRFCVDFALILFGIQSSFRQRRDRRLQDQRTAI